MNSFRTIAKPSEGLYKEKGSKFFGFAFPIRSEEDFKNRMSELKKEFHDARHHCYAFRLGADMKTYRFSDDGEPSSTAGKPIFGQIQSFELTNVGIIVIRYFGGTKLGVGGLIHAYREAAAEAINNAKIVVEEVTQSITIQFGYDHMSWVMNLIKSNDLNVLHQQFEISCEISISCPLKVLEQVVQKLEQNHEVEFKMG